MDTIAPTEERDNVFKQMLTERQNILCFDCNSKNPKWASVHLGLLICFECSGRHRGYGTHISFVRSIDLDKWKYSQLYIMLEGGNKKAKERFEELGIEKENRIYDYNDSKVIKYKEELAQKVASKYNKSNNSNTKKDNVGDNKNIDVNNKNSKTKKDDFDFEDDFKVNKNGKNNEESSKDKEKEEKITNTKVINFDENDNTNTNSSNTKKEKKVTKKNNKIEKIDNFDFDWDDDVDYIAQSNANKKDKKTESKNKKSSNNNYDDSDEEDYKNKKYTSKNNDIDDKINNNSSYKDEKKLVAKTNLENRKAICSDDFAEEGHDDNDAKQRQKVLANLKGAKAISSADLNGESDEPQSKFS